MARGNRLVTIAKPKEYRKTCKHCGEKFKPAMTTQKVCSVACAIAVAPAGRDRAQKALNSHQKQEHKAAKERVKTKAGHAREAQAAFNQWVRLRDELLPCVSCGRHHEGQYHAGHFRTTASAPELRFEPLNVHKQCAPCNNHLSGNIVNYRAELLNRIGPDKLEWLEGKHEPKRYTIEDLKAIKAEYREKVRQMKKEADQ